MNNSNESLEEGTIKFPFPITEDEIEGERKFFDYLRKTLPCDITYGRDPRKNKNIFFRGNFIRYIGSHPVINLIFEIGGGLIRFELPEHGCSKNEQLFINKVEQKTQKYFSRRPR